MRLIYFLILYVFSLLSCREQPKRSPKSDKIKDNFSTQNRVQELRKSGELFDSCQFPYAGNCLYRLCASKDLYSFSDTSWATSTSKVLVSYLLNRIALQTNENKKTAYLLPDYLFKIYSYVIFKEVYDSITFNDFVSKDISYAIERGEVVSKREVIPTSDQNKGIVYEFRFKPNQYIAVSYIDVSSYIVMIVYTANGNKPYNDNYWYFSDIVKSFKYYGD